MTYINNTLSPKNIIKYSKNGSRLLSKTQEGNVKRAIIETDFGKGLKEIVHTFAYDGKPQELTITHRDNKGKVLQKLVKSYSDEIGYTEIQTSIFKENKHLVSSCTEKQLLRKDKDGSKSLLRIKLKKHLKKWGRYEEQSYEELHNTANRDSNKTLYTTSTRLNNGELTDKTINGNLQNLEEFANDPYLHIRNYTDKEFAESASYIAAEKQGVNRGTFIDKPLKKCLGYCSRFKKNVVADSSKSPKWDIISILNHEYRHKYQLVQMNKLSKKFLNIFRSKDKKISMTPSESKEAKEFFKAFFEYKDPDSQYEEYYWNFLERDAREAGENAKTEYNGFTKTLVKTFDAKYFLKMFEMNFLDFRL